MIPLLAMLLMAQAEPSPSELQAELERRADEAIARLAANYPDCENPRPDDMRPYTLCLAETDFDRSEADMQQEWALARVRASKGPTSERIIKSEQRRWASQRDRKCQNFAKHTPVTQFSRNDLSCRARMNAERTAHLKGIAR